MHVDGVFINLKIGPRYVERHVVRDLSRPLVALNVKVVALGVVGRSPAVIVNQTPIHKIVGGAFRNVETVAGLIVNHEIDEAHIRHEGCDSGNDLDVGRIEPDVGLSAEAVCVRAVQFKISKHHVSQASKEGQRAINSRPLSRHLPERDWLFGRSFDFGVDVSNHIVAAAQPERITRLSHSA